MTEPTVLIAGAGPSGLMMAAQLAIRGVSFRIIDKNEDHTTQSRALVVHARSLEIFDQMGIADAAIQQGEKARAVNLIANGKRKIRFHLEGVGTGLTRFPYLLILEQSKTEKILNDFLAKHGKAVERKTELLDFTQNEQGVSVQLRDANGSVERSQVDWLVGADGAHSLVRNRLNIPFEGKTYDQSLFVLDCELDLQIPPNEMTLAFSDKTFAGFFPMTNGRYRIIGLVPEELQVKKDLEFEDINKDFASRIKMKVTIQHPHWLSVYHSHHRTVATFRKGRCFLCGDAAHIHSPVGAQGMNTGLQDAYNLAWKLALVCTGKANEKLLDTYHEERIVIARNLVKTTDRAFKFITSKNAKFVRLNLLPLALSMGVPVLEKIRLVRELAFKTISEIGINYRKSDISKEDPGSTFTSRSPKPGDRMPYISNGDPIEKLNGEKFYLLLFPGKSRPENKDGIVQLVRDEFDPLIAIKEIPYSNQTQHLYKKFGIKNEGYYLVRPDAYIAFRCNSLRFENFRTYLRRFFNKSSFTGRTRPPGIA